MQFRFGETAFTHLFIYLLWCTYGA